MNLIKKHKIVFLILAVLLAMAAVLLAYKLAVLKSPEKIIKQYMACIEEQDYEGMYEMLDQESQDKVTKKAFITRNQNIYEGIGAKNIEITIIEGQEKKDAVQYKTVMDSSAGKIRFPNEAVVHKEQGRYRITWNDGLIFPQLGSEDKVRVQAEKADRGTIYDRSGNVLAGKGTVAAVGLIPGKMSKDKTADLEKMAGLLDMAPADIEKKLNAKWVKPDLLVPIKKLKKINEASSSTVDLENARIQEELLKIPGVTIGDEESRVYPLGEKTAHLIGYVQGISAEELESRKDQGYDQYSVIGKSGLERLYEKRLHGQDGERIAIYNKNGSEKAVVGQRPKKDGEDIKLTIDARLQAQLYDTYQADKSCSVVLNPKSGEVMALVSTPSYDSNDFVVGMSEKRWKQLNEDPNTPMYNRYKQIWSPGSALKPVVGAIGVGTGKLDPNGDLGHSGKSWQKDSSWGGYKVTTLHEYSGPANLENALIYSDNIYFAKAALKIGADTLTKQLAQAGFGQEIPFALDMTPSQYSNDQKPIEDEIQLADSGYGQGQVLVNPLHLASMYSAFSNQGSMIKPHLEQKEETAYWIENPFDSKAADLIQQDLEKVISDPNGTGHGAQLSKIKLAGKTGTAEIKASKEDTSGTELGWFCVFSPDKTKDNSLLMVTMVEDVKDRGGSGYVVQKSKDILEKFF